MAEITIGTDSGKVSIRVLVTDKDISIFLADNCDIIGIGGLDKDKEGFQIYAGDRDEQSKAETAVAKANDDDDIPVRTQFGELG